MAKLYLIEAAGTSPYENLALESCLMETVTSDAVILYLWQNFRTVVIGKNQNAWAECRVEELERDGGSLARRPSGGGAVFHDLGNLNFSFVAMGDHYNVGRQLDVLIAAVRCFGIRAERSGRNDVLAGERKFSGNAFSSRGERHTHHGTIMVDVDTGELAKYLSVSPLKLKSKGVSSVKSRVCNLIELCPDITVPGIKKAMTAAFSEVYDSDVERIGIENVDAVRLEELTARYSSSEWKFGKRMPFTVQLEERFDWGSFTLQLWVQDGRVKEAICFTDALDVELTEGLNEAVTDRRYTKQALSEAVLELGEIKAARQGPLQDIARWLDNHAGL